MRRAYLAALMAVLVGASSFTLVPRQRHAAAARADRAADAVAMAVKPPTDARPDSSCGGPVACYKVPSRDVAAVANTMRESLQRAARSDVTPIRCGELKHAGLVTKVCTAHTTVRGRVVIVGAAAYVVISGRPHPKASVIGTRVWVYAEN
jgi:hypothetical protein